MPNYMQAGKPLIITTPLGPDTLLLSSFSGREAISQLFHFQAGLLAENGTEIHFDQILGQSVTVELRLADGGKRYFNGIVKRFSQGGRDADFVRFEAEIVPKLWLLTKKVRSRIFQHLSTPDILQRVFTGLDVSYKILATYYPRDYCVQYRESDFAFASRLMEEEGIHYYFEHADGNHQLVVSDATRVSPLVAGQSSIVYDEATDEFLEEMRVTAWKKTQEVRSGEYTLWDHCFELPGINHLEGKEKTIDSVKAGKVTHKLRVGGNDQLEIYDFPGAYAQRFDGINPSGGARPEDLKHIFEDRDRTARIRMEEEESASVEIAGSSDCANFSAGHKFTLERHFDADGRYLLTQVEHDASQSYYRTEEGQPFRYENRFSCIPDAVRYRPPRVTHRPEIAGTQTATVVGPPGEEIFVDKYGRVKVQFHWDREGKRNADSSCWIRVAQIWAGKGWGAFFWPRIGHEVVVAFEEGDPDQPQVIGSVYNEDNMPWYSLPINKQLAGLKSASTRGKAHDHYNGLVFNDDKGHEHLSIHSEHNLSLNSEDDKMIHAGRHKGERVGIANVLTVGKIIPWGGGSGGGFDEGNPMPNPPPTGVVGMNSVFTYGDNLQAAVPLNHQMVLGNNVQMCINPFGLAAGSPGANSPLAMQAMAGAGMGGSMQFTIGASAQFTLGQSFEISIGPPKIEIHAPYKDHLVVGILCGLLGALVIVFTIAYDVLKNTNAVEDYSNATTDAQKAAALAKERSGDKERVHLILAYQLLTDVLLMAILTAEALTDKVDWSADDVMKDLYKVDKACLDLWKSPSVDPDEDDAPWSEKGAVALGSLAVLGAIAAEMALASSE